MSSRWLTILIPVLLACAPGADAGRTAFDPSRHGYAFSNTFSNDFVRELDVRTGGLCGGMVYSALDYFLARQPIPVQDYRPATGTVLQCYIYDRQVQSIVPNVGRWAELGVNPNGARDAELFGWALNSRFDELRRVIDRGRPVPLGVQGVKGVTHQILAIGYEAGARAQDRRIQVYDPNFPGRTQVMRPDLAGRCFYYEGTTEARYRWRSYFVDSHYQPKRPPAIPAPLAGAGGMIRELVVHCTTGGDDLRGGNDNVHLTLKLRGGAPIQMTNINLRRRWLSNYTESARVILPRPVRQADIVAVDLTTTFGGGIGGDNWNLDRVVVEAYVDTGRAVIVRRDALVRFTGDRKHLSLVVGR